MKSKLERIQEIIADPGFRYISTNMVIITIFDAIKSGYRLCKVEELKEEIRERFKVEIDKSCEESIGGFDLIDLSADIQSIIREKTK